jgi:hypothetical protein
MVAIDRTDHKVITQRVDVEITKAIFHWHSSKESEYPSLSPDCHCLLRIYWLDNKSKAVVIASELYSNEKNIGVCSSYSDLASAVITLFPQLQFILPQVIWLSHSGQFSVPMSWAESHQRECFRQFSVQFDREQHKSEVDELEILPQKKVIKLLDGANLEHAVEVLQQLQHDNNWGRGIVDDFQVKACLELEQGIILGQKRTKGLVGW